MRQQPEGANVLAQMSRETFYLLKGLGIQVEEVSQRIEYLEINGVARQIKEICFHPTDSALRETPCYAVVELSSTSGAWVPQCAGDCADGLLCEKVSDNPFNCDCARLEGEAAVAP